jgi:hypothetical protein
MLRDEDAGVNPNCRPTNNAHVLKSAPQRIVWWPPDAILLCTCTSFLAAKPGSLTLSCEMFGDNIRFAEVEDFGPASSFAAGAQPNPRLHLHPSSEALGRRHESGNPDLGIRTPLQNVTRIRAYMACSETRIARTAASHRQPRHGRRSRVIKTADRSLSRGLRSSPH